MLDSFRLTGFHFFRHREERRMTVDLVVGWFEQRGLVARAAGDDVGRLDDPDADAFVAAGVDARALLIAISASGACRLPTCLCANPCWLRMKTSHSGHSLLMMLSLVRLFVNA